MSAFGLFAIIAMPGALALPVPFQQAALTYLGMI